MSNRLIKDTCLFVVVGCLALSMLLASHLIYRRLGADVNVLAVLTQSSLERLAGLALGLLGAAILFWLLLGIGLALLATLSASLGHRRLGARILRLVPGFTARLTVATIGGSLILATSANAAAPHATTHETAIQQGAFPATVQTRAPAAPMGPARAAIAASSSEEHKDGAQAPADDTFLWSPGWVPQRISLPLQRLLGGGTRKAQEVVVRSGDTLWSIASRHLDCEATTKDIAESWPQWYDANRDVIGSNPDRLTVGMVLTAPITQGSR